MEEVKQFVEEVLKKEYKDKILAIGLLPAPKEDPLFSKFYEESIPEEIKQQFKESLERKHVIYILNDSEIEDVVKKIEFKARAERDAIEIVKSKNLPLWIDTFLVSEINQMALDSRFEIFDLIARSQELYDPKNYIKIIRLAVTHRNLVLQKFERYVVAYVLAGSYIRGQATAKSDVDAYVVIDDTDVKRHTQWELKQKLITIVNGLAIDAQAIVKVQIPFHVQVYTLTEFWRSLREVNPVITTFLRDGIPIYDRGLFTPWKLLLLRGEIKPSPEAIEAYLKDSENLLNKIKSNIRDLFVNGIYWSIVTSAQAVIMLKGFLPPAPKEASRMLRELFVIKDKLLEEEYVKILEDAVKLYKDIEHGDVKELKGKDIDEWLEKADKFINRMKRLKTQIESRKLKEDTKKIIEEIIVATSDLLRTIGKKVERDKLVHDLEELARLGYISSDLPCKLKEIFEIEKTLTEGKIEESDINKLRKLASEYLGTIGKYIERYLIEKVSKRKIGLKVGEKVYDLYIFDNHLILKAEKIYDIHLSDESITKVEEISKEEMDRRIREYSSTGPVMLSRDILSKIEELIGKFELIF